ncbi:MAG: carboxypeptidase regulatory-like domain-containing protein [Planctomycetota bacterium]
MRVARSILASLLLIICAITGCGGPVGPTFGSVRFEDGSPVRAGSIEFRRLEDKSRFASRIAQDGSFQPAAGNGELGLPPGDYEVVVVQIVLTEDLAKEAHTHGSTVPRRYADYYTSGLRYAVDEGEQDAIQIYVQPE